MPSADRLLSDRGLQSEAWLHTCELSSAVLPLLSTSYGP